MKSNLKWWAALSTIAAMLVAPSAHALKLEDFEIKQVVIGNQYPAIHVKFDHAADNWTVVTDDRVEVNLHYSVKVKASHALANSRVSLTLDGMDAEDPLNSTNIDYAETHSDTLVLRKPGSQLVEIKKTALDTCKTIRGNGGKPNKEHRIEKLFTANGYVEAYTTATWFSEGTAHDDALVRVDVVCDKDPTWHGPLQPSGQGLAVGDRDFKVIKLELFLTTFENQYTTPTPGLRCKKLQVKVRIETSKAGQIGYKIWRQPGESIDRLKFISHQDSGPFKGRFVYEDVFVDTFDKTTYQQYMVEAAGYPVGVSTPWKDKNVICTGPGAGGVTVGQGPGGNPADELPKFRVIDANVIMRQLPGGTCPAKVRVTANYRTNMPGSFEHHLGCTTGESHSGTLDAKDPISATNYGVKYETILDVPHSGEVTCSARPVQFGQELAIRKLLVHCAGPPPGVRARPKK
jgi:hypothetical protein